MPDPIKFVIPNNIPIQLNDESSGDLLGFGIAERDGADEKQVQHWIMFTRDLAGRAFPARPVWISKATAPGWKDLRSISDFKTRASGAFLESRDLYVIANCTAHQGNTFPKGLTPPPFPLGGKEKYQGYWGLAPVHRRRTGSDEGDLFAYLFVSATVNGHTTEYWALGRGYNVPDDAYSTLVMSDPDIQGADFLRLLDGTFWDEHGTLVIAACTNYARVP